MEGQLKTKPIAKAIKVMKAFTKNIEHYQAFFAPIVTIHPNVVIRYSTANTVNNTIAYPPAITPAQNDLANSKCDPNTPPDKPTTAPAQHQKKAHCAFRGNSPTKHSILEIGMFYLHKPDMKASNTFLTNLPEKVCTDFTCKGK
jgi:hypothetical protein